MTRIRATELREAGLLFVLGGLSIISAGDPHLYYVLLAAGALFAVWAALSALKMPETLNGFSLFRLSVLLGYFLGPSIAVAYWLTHPRVPVLMLIGPFAFHGYHGFLSLAMMSAYFASALLSILAGMARPITVPTQRPASPAFGNEGMLLIVLATLIIAVAISQGDLGYMGVVAAPTKEISPLGAIGGLLLPAMIAILFYGLLNPAEPHWRRLFYLALLLSYLAALTITGRRHLIFAIFAAMILGVLVRSHLRSFFVFSRVVTSPRRLVFIGLIVGFVLVADYGFNALRYATDRLGPGTALTIRIAYAATVASSGFRVVEVRTSVSPARPGTLPGYLGRLESSPQGSDRPMLGRCLLYGLFNSIPRALFPDKTEVLRHNLCTDEAVNARMHLPQVDSPTTLLTKGYVDFGLLGALVYPVIFATLFQLVGRFVRRSRMTAFRLLALAVLLNAAVFVEENLAFYIVAIRNLLLLYAVVWILHLGFLWARFESRLATKRTMFPSAGSP